MNIGIIAPCPFVVDRGTPLRILGFCKGFSELEHNVTICTYHLGRDVNLKNVIIKRIPYIPIYKKISAGPSLGKPFIDLILLKKVFQVFRDDKFDFIFGAHFEGALIGILLKKFRDIPLVFDVHSSLFAEMVTYDIVSRNILLQKILKFTEKYIARGSDCVTTSSPVTRDLLMGYGISAEKVKFVPDGVDLSQYGNNESVRKRYGFSSEDKVVVYSGNLKNYQGIGYLLEALKEIKKSRNDVKCIIIGFPSEEYEKMAKKMKLLDSVIFTGQVAFDRVPDYLTSADILIAPRISTPLTDTQRPLKFMSYFAAGKPIIATDIPAHKTLLKDRVNALLIKEKSSAEISDAILRLLDDNALSKKLSSNAKKASLEYSWEKSANEVLDMYYTIR